MPPAQTSAVPNDLALWDAMRIGTVGTGDGVEVELVRYPGDRRYWCRVRRGENVTDCTRTFAPGVLVLWLWAAHGIDAHSLAWMAGEWAASAVNPWTTKGAG